MLADFFYFCHFRGKRLWRRRTASSVATFTFRRKERPGPGCGLLWPGQSRWCCTCRAVDRWNYSWSNAGMLPSAFTQQLSLSTLKRSFTWPVPPVWSPSLWPQVYLQSRNAALHHAQTRTNLWNCGSRRASRRRTSQPLCIRHCLGSKALSRGWSSCLSQRTAQTGSWPVRNPAWFYFQASYPIPAAESFHFKD